MHVSLSEYCFVAVHDTMLEYQGTQKAGAKSTRSLTDVCMQGFFLSCLQRRKSLEKRRGTRYKWYICSRLRFKLLCIVPKIEKQLHLWYLHTSKKLVFDLVPFPSRVR